MQNVIQAIRKRTNDLFLRKVTAFQGRTITPAHPDEPHMQKYGKFGQNPIPLLGDESKMRLLETQSHTSERPGYEARQNAKKRN